MYVVVPKENPEYQFGFSKNTGPSKAELLLLKLIHSFAREVLLVKKLEIEET